MTYHGPVPEDGLVPIAQIVTAQVVPFALEDQRRTAAVKWITNLCRTIWGWHEDFLKLMNDHPAFRDSTISSDYRAFLRVLSKYRHDLDTREGYVKAAICAPIEEIRKDFENDFAWLRIGNPQAYDSLRLHLDRAYQTESGVIEAAQHLVANVLQGENYAPYETLLSTPGYIQWQIAHRNEKRELIAEYKAKSAAAIHQLKDIALNTQTNFLKGIEERRPEDHAIVGSGGVASERLQALRKELAMELQGTPQAENRLLYAIMAFGFGAVGVGIVLLMAWHTADPSPFQRRVFTSVLAVALGGVATVMSGLLKTDFTLGNQLKVGATGAFAVFALTYFFAPA